MIELKPCPFCGGEAKIEIDEDGSAFVTVEHEDCCYLDGIDTTQWFYAYDGKNPAQVAAEVWNRRAERTCRDFGGMDGTDGDCYDFACDACGYCCDVMAPNYCPNCGAKVVERMGE